MSEKLTCHIPPSPIQYEIEIGHDILKESIEFLGKLAPRFAILTDDLVYTLHGKQLQTSLKASGLEAHLFSFPPGEQNKTRKTKEFLENSMFEAGLGRDTCIIALGGGVVTDIAGYVAATYCRGIPFVMMPTSLLGMVDASIGGKTGVDVPYGKNLIGSIYQPKKVIIDLSTLKSLPKKELSNGAVEIIKHGIIADLAFFEYLETHSSELLSLAIPVIEKAVFHSCQIKKIIVEKDEKEQGERRLLNAGHTIGHALEQLTNFSLTHGEAVAIGLVVESYIALQLGALSKSSFDRIQNILYQYGLPLQLPTRFPPQALYEIMALDKKSKKGQPRFVILDTIGSPRSYNGNYCTHVEESLLKNALQWMNDALYPY